MTDRRWPQHPHSPKREVRRRIAALYEQQTGKPLSGRHWVKLRKLMTRAERAERAHPHTDVLTSGGRAA